MRVATLFAMALAVCAMAFSLVGFAHFSAGTLFSDFRGFYCAATLERQGIDSYRQEPLYTCEAERTAPSLWRATGGVTDPAPLPPYALAAFVPLTFLPYTSPVWLWALLLLCAWILVVAVVQRLTCASWTLTLSSFAFAAMLSISLGQISPIAIAAIVIAALCVDAGRYGAAAVAAVAATIEPHVALPVCLTMFVALPRTRIPMMLSGSVLLAISFAFGMARNVEYIFAVLPAHAVSDVWDVGQYSAT